MHHFACSSPSVATILVLTISKNPCCPNYKLHTRLGAISAANCAYRYGETLSRGRLDVSGSIRILRMPVREVNATYFRVTFQQSVLHHVLTPKVFCSDGGVQTVRTICT